MTDKWHLTIVNISYLQNISLKCKFDPTEPNNRPQKSFAGRGVRHIGRTVQSLYFLSWTTVVKEWKLHKYISKAFTKRNFSKVLNDLLEKYGILDDSQSVNNILWKSYRNAITPRVRNSWNCNTSYNAYFAVYGFKILCEILKGKFEIWRKILHPCSTHFHCTYFCFCVRFTISLICDVIKLSGAIPMAALSNDNVRSPI